MRKKIHISKSFLHKEYTNNKKPVEKISEEFGYSEAVIWNRIKEYKIKTNIYPAWNKNTRKKCYCIECNCLLPLNSKAERCRKCHNIYLKNYPENSNNYIDGQTLKKYYCKDCGKEIEWRNALYKTGRCLQCSNKGKNNGRYIDGRSLEIYPSEYTPYLRQKIRKRDNYTCQKCYIIEEEHIKIYGAILDIHHIDYDKQNCNEGNLITLCHKCNLRVNYNRKYWENYFSSIISDLILV